MKFRETTSVTLDSETIKEAKTWATKEHLQLSSYIQEAVEMRNKWHQRQQENMIKAANELTIEKAKELVLQAMTEIDKEKYTEKDLEAVEALAKKLWK